jgi:hypothetical protein
VASPLLRYPLVVITLLGLAIGHTNIAALHPDVVADLVREAEAHKRTVAPGRPLFDELLPASKAGAR